MSEIKEPIIIKATVATGGPEDWDSFEVGTYSRKRLCVSIDHHYPQGEGDHNLTTVHFENGDYSQYFNTIQLDWGHTVESRLTERKG